MRIFHAARLACTRGPPIPAEHARCGHPVDSAETVENLGVFILHLRKKSHNQFIFRAVQSLIHDRGQQARDIGVRKMSPFISQMLSVPRGHRAGA